MRTLFDRDADGSLKDSVKFILVVFATGLVIWPVFHTLARLVTMSYWQYYRSNEVPTAITLFFGVLKHSLDYLLVNFFFFCIISLCLILLIRKKLFLIPITSAIMIFGLKIYFFATNFRSDEFSLESTLDLGYDFLFISISEVMVPALVLWFICVYLYDYLKARTA